MSLLSYIITKSGWIYTEVASSKASDIILGSPSFYPDDNGNRVFRNTRYSKFSHRTDPTQNAPQYIVQPYNLCSHIYTGSSTALIPKSEVDEYVNICDKYREWLTANDPRMQVIKRILTFAEVPTSHVGLAGSRATGLDHQRSDIDIVVYGSQYVAACLSALEGEIYNGSLRFMSSSRAKRYAQYYSGRYNINADKLIPQFQFDVSKVFHFDSEISFIFTYHEHEQTIIPESIYEPEGSTISLEGWVISWIPGWLFPRNYLVQTEDNIVYSVWSHHWFHKAAVSPHTRVKILGRKCGDRLVVIGDAHHELVRVL